MFTLLLQIFWTYNAVDIKNSCHNYSNNWIYKKSSHLGRISHKHLPLSLEKRWKHKEKGSCSSYESKGRLLFFYPLQLLLHVRSQVREIVVVIEGRDVFVPFRFVLRNFHHKEVTNRGVGGDRNSQLLNVGCDLLSFALIDH